MGRGINRLTAMAIQKMKEPGKYCDGGGLYLQMAGAGTKSWIFRYRALNGKSREMGLGSLATVSLQNAREKANECRKLLAKAKDPIAERDASIEALRAEAVRAKARAVTFRQCAEEYIDSFSMEWKNEKHVDQWRNTIKSYANPFIGDLPVSDVSTELILEILRPIWIEKPETATRLRGRLESVLDWATVKKLRSGENPARWKGHLASLLPTVPRSRRVKHHPALPFSEMAEFMTKLAAVDGLSARALEVLILSLTRTSETLQAKWCEFDFESDVWTIPGERMKAGKEHRVPLSKRLKALLLALQTHSTSEFVFPGIREGKPLSNMSMLVLMRRMGYGERAVPHGFRSSFRDWAAECTSFSHEVVEMALAHTIGNKVEAAYRRGDLLTKRRHLMDEWASYCQGGKVKRASLTSAIA
jgi:integrase